MEALALIDMLLTDPTMVPDHSSLVEEIMKHSKALATHEAAMITLQQYFNPKQASPAQTLRQPQPPLTPARHFIRGGATEAIIDIEEECS